MSNDQKHKRPKFSLEFKQDAAQLVLEKGYSHQQAAEHLGISLSALERWVRAERKPLSPDSVTRKVAINLADHDELVRLRKENDQLRMEREILKNRLPGTPVPYAKKQVALHWLDARTLAVSFLEVKIPVKKPGRWETADPNVAAL